MPTVVLHIEFGTVQLLLLVQLVRVIGGRGVVETYIVVVSMVVVVSMAVVVTVVSAVDMVVAFSIVDIAMVTFVTLTSSDVVKLDSVVVELVFVDSIVVAIDIIQCIYFHRVFTCCKQLSMSSLPNMKCCQVQRLHCLFHTRNCRRHYISFLRIMVYIILTYIKCEYNGS
jgi:hypothetical protein